MAKPIIIFGGVKSYVGDELAETCNVLGYRYDGRILMSKENKEEELNEWFKYVELWNKHPYVVAEIMSGDVKHDPLFIKLCKKNGARCIFLKADSYDFLVDSISNNNFFNLNKTGLTIKTSGLANQMKTLSDFWERQYLKEISEPIYEIS